MPYLAGCKGIRFRIIVLRALNGEGFFATLATAVLMRVFLFSTFCFLSACPGAQKWSPLPPGEIGKKYECARAIGTGGFEFRAAISLARIDGTAASVMFGNDLNFGFDGRRSGLFVEGDLVTADDRKKLGKRDLKAKEEFLFAASRNGDGITEFRIDGDLLLRTKSLSGRAFPITFRPHRNVMTVTSFSLTGDLGEIPEDEVKVIRTPLLVGAENPLLKISLNSNKGLKIRRVLTNSDHLTNLKIQGEQLVGSLPKDFDLLKEVELTFQGVEFEDGSFFRAPLKATYRAAYPIHRQGEFECHTTRIPAMARTKKGTLLGVYDLRYRSAKDLQEHIDIGLSRSMDRGQTWEEPRAIMDMGEFGGKSQSENGCSDPNILIDPASGRIFVSAVWTHGKPGTHQWVGKGSEPGYGIHQSSQFMMVYSDDDGLTWSKPENWTKRLKKEEWHLFAPAPGNGISLKDGTLVMPTQGRDAEGRPFSNITWSRDGGESWTVSKPARSNTTECSVVELSDGRLMLNMRDNRNRSDKSSTNGRAVAVSRDLGETWEKHSSDHGALPEPTCMASLIRHGEELYFSNPHHKSVRSHITVQRSRDWGKTWPEENHVLLDEGKGRGYSSLVMVDDDTIGVLYESSRANLVFQKLPLKAFE